MTTHSYSTSPRAIVASLNESINQNNTQPAVSVNINSSRTITLIDGFKPMGIDLAARKYQICYQDSMGRMINKEVSKSELRLFLINAEDKYLICIEACSGASYWSRFAQAYGHTVKVVSGKMTRALSLHRNKDDFTDAYSLYQLLFMPGLNSCQIRTEEELAMSALISEKEALLKNLNEQTNKTRSFLLETGEYDDVVRGGPSAVYAIDRYLNNHQSDYSEHRYSIRCFKVLKETIVFLSKRIDEINELICEYAQHNEKAKLLMTIPGIGAETAVPIAIGAKDISRFDSARQFQAFFGYHTSHSGSGGKVVMGKMASNGDRAVKRNLYESALSVYHQGKSNNEPRSEWIVAKTEQNKAAFKKGMICIGSKILRTSYGVLKSGKPYNPAVDNSLGRMKSRLHRRSNPKYREQGFDAVLQSKYEQELSLTALDKLPII